MAAPVVNPTIVDDNFDDNDISDWDDQIGTIVAANQRVEITIASGGSDRARQTVTGATEYYMSWEFQLVSGYTVVGDQDCQGMGISDASYHQLIYVGFHKTDAGVFWHTRYATDGGTVTANHAAFSTDTWYTITCHWKASTGAGNNDGIVQVWIDDTLILDLSNVDNDTLTCNRCFLGNNYSQAGFTSAEFYIDDVKMGGVVSAGADPMSTTLRFALGLGL